MPEKMGKFNKKKRNDAADTSMGRVYMKDIPFDYIIVVYAL